MDRQCIVAFVAALVAMATMPVVVAGQAPDGWTVPRTSDGRPDLQGTWSSDSATPLQRPEALAARVTLSDDEVAALQAHATESLNGGGDAVFGDTVFLRALASLEEPAEDQQVRVRAPFWSYDQQWMSGRWFDNRTSLIVDPPNGRLPSRTPEAEERAKRRRAARDAATRTIPQTVDEELGRLDPGVRCRGGGVLLDSRGYNSNYYIFQAVDYVGIQQEMYHDTRLIPISEVAPSQFVPRSAMGSSRGYWEGDTLMVETTNLSRGVGGSTLDVRVTERFNRVGPETLQYEYTLDDPSTWTQPWTARILMRPTPGTGVMYEYACHEGNYAAELVLRSARAEELGKSE